MRNLRMAAALAIAAASCSIPPESHKYEAEYSAWALELTWLHRWQVADSKQASRFESLKLILKPSRVDEDLKIDGDDAIGTFQHGGEDWCTKAHLVSGTVRLLENAATSARARVDAVMRCGDAEPVALKGEFSFDVKIPP